MKKTTKVILVTLFLLFSFCFLFYYSWKHHSYVTVNGKSFSVEIADTNVTRQRGLSGHKPLKDDEGMIFVFEKPDDYGFWMKDMLFPIDILWIDANMQVVHIEKSVATSTYPQIFYSGTISQYALEIKSGQSDSHNIKIGDKITFTDNSR